MSALRPSTDHQRNALKKATKRALRAAGGGASFQHATRVAEAQLSRYAGDSYPDFMPIDIALDCDLDAGSPVIAASLAVIQGYRLVREPAAGAGAATMTDLAAVVRETADVTTALIGALEDGAVTPAEAERLNQEIEEAIAELRRLQGKVFPRGVRP